jgi:methylated-DNA-protein-cysteine methyltransferase-like protein
MPSSTKREAILTTLHQIPAGKVIAYGQLAAAAGLPGAARLVGRVLGELPEDSQVPWHRVVSAQGKISLPPDSPGFIEQERRLRAEGVNCVNGKLSLKRYQWSG